MPKVTVTKNTSKPAQETFNALKEFLNNDPELRKMDSGYECQFQDADMCGTAKGKKFSADLNVKENGGSTDVEITVDLPMMMGPFKGVVQQTLEKKLDKLLG